MTFFLKDKIRRNLVHIRSNFLNLLQGFKFAEMFFNYFSKSRLYNEILVDET